MGKSNTEIWKEGCDAGQEIVFNYLSEMLPIDIEALKEDFERWENADEYITFRGDKVNRCG